MSSIPITKTQNGGSVNNNVIRDRSIKMYGKALLPNWPAVDTLRFIPLWVGGAHAKNWNVTTSQLITPSIVSIRHTRNRD